MKVLKNLKKERGSITLFVLIACMFVLMILLIVNIGVINKKRNQEKELEEISKQYNQNETELNDEYEKIADEGDYHYLTKNEIREMLYPIGSIYITTNEQNPSVYIGGEWESYAEGRTIIGVGKSDEEFGIGETGGNSKQDLRALIGAIRANTGTLGYKTSARIPNNSYTYAISGTHIATNIPVNEINHSTMVLQQNGGDPSTLQPYIATYVWKRVS